LSGSLPYVVAETDPVFMSLSGSLPYVVAESDPVFMSLSGSLPYVTDETAITGSGSTTVYGSFPNFTIGSSGGEETDPVFMSLSGSLAYEPTLTKGDLTVSGTGLVIYGGTDAVIGTGTSIAVNDTGQAALYDTVVRNSLAVLELKAAASATSPDYNYMLLDTFSDNTGYDNTVDTGNTTATFSTNKYHNVTVGESVNDAHGVSLGTGSTTTGARGFRILAEKQLNLISVVKDGSCTATRCILKSDAGATIATATFSTNTATFTGTNVLTSGAYYRIEADKAGASYTYRGAAASYPYDKTNIQFYYGSVGGNNDSDAWNLASVNTQTYTPGDLIVQTVKQDTTFSGSSYQLYCPATVVGTGTVTYDISFNNGTNYSTGKSLNTAYAVGSYPGDDIILKVNLNKGASDGTAEVTGYALLIW